MDAIYGFIDAGSIAHRPSYEKNLALFENSEFENIKGLFGITRMMIEGNSEIKNVFISRRRCEFTLGKTCIAQRTSNKVDKSKSVRLLGLRVMHGKTARSRRCNEKVEWSSVNFEDVLFLQRIARIKKRSDWFRVENLTRSQSIGHSPQNASRPTKKEHHTWKKTVIEESSCQCSMTLNWKGR